MAMAELHLIDGSTLIDNRRDVGQHQLEQAMNHWLDAGSSPLLIQADDASLTLVPAHERAVGPRDRPRHLTEAVARAPGA